MNECRVEVETVNGKRFRLYVADAIIDDSILKILETTGSYICFPLASVLYYTIQRQEDEK